MYRKTIALAVFLTISGFLFQFSIAQDFIKMSNEQYVQLALDMVRKGVQEEDTTKVIMVLAPQVLVKSKGMVEKASLIQKLRAAFDNSSERKLALERPPFSRDDNPRHNSNFWDFDILDPRITINGDSAFVDCELVLWGTPGTSDSQGVGGRTSERFVFVSPPKIPLAVVPDGSNRWPASTLSKDSASKTKSWQLVGCENLFEFLENQVILNTMPKEKSQGENR